MRHAIELDNGGLRSRSSVEYAWHWQGRWNSLRGVAIGVSYAPTEGSAEEFITEHYWGYTAQRNGECAEYRVEHERWNLWRAQEAVLDCDVASLYGAKFVQSLGAPPESAFIAEGSPVSVGTGRVL